MDASIAMAALGGAGALAALPAIARRIELSRAKHRSLAGHSRLSRRVARQVPYYAFEGDRFFDADGAPAEVASQRRSGFERLAALYETRYTRTRERSADVLPGLSDLQFTSRYRVPFPFSETVRTRLSAGSFVSAAQGCELVDLDGNRLIDLTGSYGVNLLVGRQGRDILLHCLHCTHTK